MEETEVCSEGTDMRAKGEEKTGPERRSDCHAGPVTACSERNIREGVGKEESKAQREEAQ